MTTHRRTPSGHRTAGRRPARVVAGAAAAAAALAVTGCGGGEGIDGSVKSVRAGQGEARTLTGGWVAVLTPDQASAFFAAAGSDQPGPEELPYLTTRVRHEGVLDAGGSLVAVDDEGKFATRARGPHYLCLLREVTNQPDLLRGCASLTLPEHATLELTMRADRLESKLDD